MDFYNKIVEILQSIGNFFSMPSFTADFSAAINYINFVLYFVPAGTIITIFGVWVSINIVSFLIRTIKTVWDLVPMV